MTADTSTRFLVVVLYFMTAAAAYNGFFTKWQMRDDAPTFSLAAMLDGTAKRPWVYRQLIPTVANLAERALPAQVTQKAVRIMLSGPEGMPISKIDTTLGRDPEYTLRYHGVLYLTFGLFLGALFVLRALCIQVTGDVLAGTLAPLGFALMMPILQTMGGYFYDFVELLFMAAVVYAIVRQKWIWLAPLTVLATTNKEAFLFFAITLYPIARMHLSRARAAGLIAALVAISGISYLPLRALYVNNPGDAAFLQLWGNLAFYANPVNLLRPESTYNMIMPKGYNVIVLLVVALVIRKGWPDLDAAWRQHLMLAAAVNLPLLLLYCAPGEMRNLSLCYVGFVVSLATALSQWIADATPTRTARVSTHAAATT